MERQAWARTWMSVSGRLRRQVILSRTLEWVFQLLFSFCFIPERGESFKFRNSYQTGTIMSLVTNNWTRKVVMLYEAFFLFSSLMYNWQKRTLVLLIPIGKWENIIGISGGIGNDFFFCPVDSLFYYGKLASTMPDVIRLLSTSPCPIIWVGRLLVDLFFSPVAVHTFNLAYPTMIITSPYIFVCKTISQWLLT